MTVPRVLLAVAAAAAALLVASCTVDGEPTVAPPPPSAPTADLSNPFRLTSAADGVDPKVVVTVVEDMACPACKLFESTFGSTLDELAHDSAVAVDYRVVSFLDRVSSDDYSSRAANASYCAWAASPGLDGDWRAVQHRMFADQPAEGGAGLSDAELTSIAVDTLGSAGDAVATCIQAGQYAGQVKSNTSSVMDESWFRGTPTVRINGADFTPSSPTALRAAVDAAKR